MRVIQRWQYLPLALSLAMTLGRGVNAEGDVTPSLLAPNGIVRLLDGSLLISDIESHRIFHLDAFGHLTFWGGTGQANYSGDGQRVTQAALNAPNDLKLDVANNAVLIADSNSHRIRKVDLRTLTITTIAGNGSSELSGDHGPAIQAGLNNPQGIAVDHLGNVLVADTYNHVIRRIGIDGLITTVGGSTAGLSGDGGPATSAQLSLPMAVAFDTDNRSFYICDSGNSRIRRVSSDGMVETVCGVGKGSDDAGAGFSGDGELATKAKIFSALDLAIASPNSFYFSDSGNQRIRSVVHGVVFSVAGSGHPSTSGKRPANIDKIDKSESISTLSVPAKIAIAPDGGLYFCDRGNRSIRHLLKNGKIETLSIRAQEKTTAKEPIPELPQDAEHAPAKVSRARSDAEISEQTSFVVAKLPKPAKTNPEIVRRNHIDDHLFAAMHQDNIPHAALSDDYTFLRRVHLDLTGRIPTPDQIATFVSSPDIAKRDREIDRLIASDAWVDKWAYWYGDLFRNCANRIGNPATENLDKWIRQSLSEDKPYNQMVTELLTSTASSSVWMPDAAPSGYLARWHIPGDTMYSDRHEDTSDEIVIQSSKFFLGINFQCISCHGGAGFLEKVDLGLSKKKREDLWALAAFFGKTRVRIVPFQDRFTISEDGTGYDSHSASSVRLHRNGEPVQPTFMLSGEPANHNRPLRTQFATMLTSHPQFAKATANLFWKEFFGIGIVEPVDGFDLARQDPANPPPAPWTIQPTNPKLLEDLGDYFVDNGYSLKSLMRVITQSSAYQLSSHFDAEWQASYTPYFARHYVCMLSSEGLHDAIVEATGVYPDYPRKHMLYGTPQSPIRYWTQAATPENIGDGDAKQLLRTFGQSNREWANPAKNGSILQAMMMMNSKFVTSRVTATGGSFSRTMLDSNLTEDQIVEAMYLRSLSRKPTEHEREIARHWITENRQIGIEDLQWSLLNKLDFLFNY